MNTPLAVRAIRPFPARKWALTSVAVIILAAVITYLALSLVVVEKFSMPERHALTRTPADYGRRYETVHFASAVDHIPLEGWYIDSPGSHVILMLHGRNGNREEGPAALPLMQALVAHNYDVFMFDFRGHGNSGAGRLSFGQFETRDVAGAMDYLRSRGVKEVGVLGFSLGALTAINSAPYHSEIRAVIADSSFADMYPWAEQQLTRMAGLPGFFMPGVAVTARLLHGIDIDGNSPARTLVQLGSRPVLLIHGTEDQDMPVANAYLLQQAAAHDPNFELWIVPGSGHTQAYPDHPQEYRRRALSFYDRYLGPD